MSYSTLIQKDSPAIFWSLDDTSGNVAMSDKFIVDATGSRIYNGTYSTSITDSGDIQSIKFPIVFGEKSSIKLLNSATISIPSLDKMSLKDCGNSSSLEFWIKIEKTSPTEQVIMYKGDQTNPEVKISIINDYIIYSIGTTTKKQSVAVHIDSVNKPIHIVAGYSKSEITLIVNGIKSTEKLYNYKSYFSLDYVTNPFIFQKPSGIDIFQIDSIALYSYVLTREQALRHFVYGIGYSIPSEFFDRNNGVYYNFSMQDHQFIKSFDFGGTNPWSITDSNNCVSINNQITIKNYPEPSLYFSQKNDYYSKIESIFKSGNYVSFSNDYYMLIENTSSIIPVIDGGWAFKFNKNNITITSNQEKPLFSLLSNNSDEQLSFTITNSSIKVYYIYLESKTEISSISYGTLADNFYVGFYIKNDRFIDTFYLSQTSNIKNTSTQEINFQFNSPFIRIGSTNSWSFNNSETTKSLSSNDYIGFNMSKIIAIHKDNLSYYSTFSSIEGSSFKHYYTVTPNYLEKRFNIQSFATAQINIPLSALVESSNLQYTGASRIEIGNPLGSTSVTTSISGSTYIDGIEQLPKFLEEQTLNDRIITSGSWLNKQNIIYPSTSIDQSDVITFNFNLSTNDLVKTPPILDYFRLFSYPVIEEGTDKYLTCNVSPGGNPAKIYYRNNEYSTPDITEFPFFYNGYSSGLKIKDSYVKITQDYTFPSIIQTINSATKTGSTLYYTLNENNFSNGDKVVVSQVYNNSNNYDTQWNFSTPVTIDLNPSLQTRQWNKITDYTWVSGTYYNTNDIVYFSNSFYKKTGYPWGPPFPSAYVTQIPPTIPIQWQQITSYNYKSTWSNSSKYSTNNAVLYNGSYYYYSGDNTICIPTSNSSTFSSYTNNEEYKGIMSIASGIQTISFMLYIPSTTTSASIISVGGNQMSLSSNTLSLSGATIYINGVAGSTIKTNSWNNIIFVFTDPVYITDSTPKDIILGNVSGTSEFYVDQLMIFDKKFTVNNVTNLYNLLTDSPSVKVEDFGITIIDSNKETIYKEEIQFSNIIDSKATDTASKYWYDKLIDGSTPKTITLNYTPTLNKDLTSIKASTTNQITVSSVDKLNKNTAIGSNDGSYIYSISTIDNNNQITTILDDPLYVTEIEQLITTKTTTSAINGKKKANNIVFTLNNVTNIEVGQSVTVSGFNFTNAKVTRIVSGTKKVTVSFNKTNFETIPSKNKIIFKSHPIVTLSDVINVKMGDIINFRDDENIENEQYLKINDSYLKKEDYFLVSEDFSDTSKLKYLYKIQSEIEEDYDQNTKQKIITLTKEELNNYINYVFIENNNDYISEGYKLTKPNSTFLFEKATLYLDPKVSATIVKEL